MSAVNGYTRSLGGKEIPGPLELTLFPEVNVPVCVGKSMSGTSVSKCEYSVSEIACVSACVKRRRIQTGDMNGEPGGPHGVIPVTAPVPRDAAYEARSAFHERPSCARLHGGISSWERPAFRERPSRGRLKCRRVLMEFGKLGFPCARVCKASRAACRVFCSRNARSGFPGRCARAACTASHAGSARG